MLVGFTSVSFAQTIISGQVIDESSNEAVIGANVSIEGTSTGAITDFDGNFAFEARGEGKKNDP